MRESRTGAVGVVAAGALASGAASVAGLALATRALGPGASGPLAVAWALAVVVGPGLWASVEQETARATAAGEGLSAVAGVVRRRAALAAPVVAAAGLVFRHQVFRGSVAVPLALGAVAAAYGPLHLAWGRLAGERRRAALAATIAIEGAARLALVAGAAAVTNDPGASAAALAASVGAAAMVARAAAGRLPPRPETGGTAERIRALTWAGLLSQGPFLTSPAVFELLAPAGDGRTARLAVAVVLARAPALAWRGVLAAVVPAVAAARAGAEAAVARAVLVVAPAAAAAGAAAAAVLGDPVLDLLTGSGPDLGRGPLALLAVATAAFLGALTATSALAGAGRARAAAWAWAGGGVASIAVALVPGDPLRRVVTALAAGTAVALAGVAGACLRSAGAESEDG